MGGVDRGRADRGMNILVVDDEPEVGNTLGDLLKRRQHTVTVTTSGREGVALASAQTFDIVILDVRMPDMDGFAVLRALRAAGCAAGIVMLTGQGDVDDAVRASQLGADEYLPKPVRLAALDRVLAAVAATPRHRQAPPS
jgi:DNA-binding response OmpR family regulator